MHSFLLIGQSNMAGRGFIEEALPVHTERIYILRNGRWQKMFRPINPDRAFSGVSLAESFAAAYAEKYDTDVGLICCADGGTTMEQWSPDGLLYDHAVMNARLAARTSDIVGILWHQGESDCISARHAVYRERLNAMLCRLRKDLRLENVPVLLGGLGDYLKDCPRPKEELYHYPIINAALQEIAKTNQRIGFVSAEGLSCNPDQLHFSAAALHEFGLRYFAAYEALTGGKAIGGTSGAHVRRSDMELL